MILLALFLFMVAAMYAAGDHANTAPFIALLIIFGLAALFSGPENTDG